MLSGFSASDCRTASVQCSVLIVLTKRNEVSRLAVECIDDDDEEEKERLRSNTALRVTVDTFRFLQVYTILYKYIAAKSNVITHFISTISQGFTSV